MENYSVNVAHDCLSSFFFQTSTKGRIVICFCGFEGFTICKVPLNWERFPKNSMFTGTSIVGKYCSVREMFYERNGMNREKLR